MKKISQNDWFLFGLILLGIAIIELQHLSFHNVESIIFAFFAVLVAAASYPLGNRKIMIINHLTDKLNTDERILGMLLCSLPIWLICSLIGLVKSGLPSISQVHSSFLIALFSGVIATYLFFSTQYVHKNLKKLAAVEAIQSLEVIFSIILGITLLKDPFPNILTLFGLTLVIVGIVFKVLKS